MQQHQQQETDKKESSVLHAKRKRFLFSRLSIHVGISFGKANKRIFITDMHHSLKLFECS